MAIMLTTIGCFIGMMIFISNASSRGTGSLLSFLLIVIIPLLFNGVYFKKKSLMTKALIPLVIMYSLTLACSPIIIALDIGKFGIIIAVIYLICFILVIKMWLINAKRQDNASYYIVLALFVFCIIISSLASFFFYVGIKNIAGKTTKEEQFVSLPLAELKKGWNRIYIDGAGSFDIPPTMEIEEGQFKQIRKAYFDTYLKFDKPTFQLTIQQKGLNNFDKEAFGKYTMVAFRTNVGEKGDYATLNFNINEFSQSDTIELDKEMRLESKSIW